MLRPTQTQPTPNPQVAAPVAMSPNQNISFAPPNQVLAPAQNTGPSLNQLMNPQAQPAQGQAVIPQMAPQNPVVSQQIASMQHQLARLEQLQNAPQAVPQAAPTAAPEPIYPYLPPVELSDNTKNIMQGPMLTAVQQVADAMFAERLNEALQGFNSQAAQYEETISNMQARMDDMKNQIFEGDITNLAPQFQTMRDHPLAAQYLSQKENFSNRTGAQILAEAEKNGDASTVARITNGFTAWAQAQANQNNYQQMAEPIAQQIPNMQVRNPNPAMNPPAPHAPVPGAEYMQPQLGMGLQSQSYNPSMPQQHSQPARYTDYQARQSQMEADMLNAQSEGRFEDAAKLSKQIETMGLAAAEALDVGTLINS